nr:hypothetical protein [Delftia acidovorans]
MDKPEKFTNDTFLKKAAYQVENALSMYAVSCAMIPAKNIYDKELLTQFEEIINTCHIYIIGYTPILQTIDVEQKERKLLFSIISSSEKYVIELDLPGDFTLKTEGETHYLTDNQGEKYGLQNGYIQRELSRLYGAFNFEVKYIGQAYGKDGSRNALDRLVKHETLQKIALKGAPEGHEISLLLLSIESGSQLITTISPFAANIDKGGDRFQIGLEKLYKTSELERISIYEAALIRYFYPEFNKEFKESFPSTNLNILKDCYEKDFSAVVAEISIDELPCQLWSKTVGPKWSHIAAHHLHEREDRRIFFGL